MGGERWEDKDRPNVDAAAEAVGNARRVALAEEEEEEGKVPVKEAVFDDDEIRLLRLRDGME